METPVLEVILLGVLQGLTEFLPVSSDGHLALAEILFGTEHAGFTLNVMLHAGTLLAILIVLRQRVGRAMYETALAARRPSRFVETAGGRDALVVVLATLPTGIMGIALRDLVEHWTSQPLVVGIGFLITAIVLASTRWVKPGNEEWPTWVGALLIGIAQGVAVLPGVSRSAGTITMALWLGVRPDRAFELSMLISLPAVLGAILLELPKVAQSPSGFGGALIGAVVALAVGIVALLALRRSIVGGHFSLFALWVLPLGVATLALARAWPGG